jgi:excisionase family DNA binding protein
MTQSRYRTTEEVAEHFRTSDSTVRYWRMTGYLKGIRIGRRVLYSDDELKEFEAKRRAEDSGDAA